MQNLKASAQQKLILGFAGVVCLSALQYKTLHLNNMLLFSGLAIVVAVMWALLFARMTPATPVTVRAQVIVGSGHLLISASVFFAATQWLLAMPTLRISVFVLAYLAYLLALLGYCKQRQATLCARQ